MDPNYVDASVQITLGSQAEVRASSSDACFEKHVGADACLLATHPIRQKVQKEVHLRPDASIRRDNVNLTGQCPRGCGRGVVRFIDWSNNATVILPTGRSAMKQSSTL